ncbi:MAG: alpha/beta hydrolase [Methylomonas lenta]|nr:alpha/beta hydrolase [Methylomonas lenta]
MRLVFRRLIGLCLILGLAACASPTAKLYAYAEHLSLQTLELKAGKYRLTAFYQPGLKLKKRLHVYLEGDGRPWQRGYWPAADPTTRSSVMLPLLAMDQAPALYLGRPCYNGHAEDAGCQPSLWTNARYGEEVVSAMETALKHFCQQWDYQELVLIGHSGGGTLALLLAERMRQTRMIITLAGNYDIDAWTEFHHYLPLNESINPARLMASGVTEWHFLAEQDDTVPPELFLTALQQRANSQVEVILAIDHQHGWEKVWPQILKRLGD